MSILSLLLGEATCKQQVVIGRTQPSMYLQIKALVTSERGCNNGSIIIICLLLESSEGQGLPTQCILEILIYRYGALFPIFVHSGRRGIRERAYSFIHGQGWTL